MKLNLGAGMSDLRESGYLNHDIRKHSPHIDLEWNCDIIPYPVEDNTFEEIRAISCIEHFRPTMMETLNEFHRILIPNGKLILKYPRFTSETITRDPTHIWTRWDEYCLYYFDPEYKHDKQGYGKQYSFYTDLKWRIIDLQVVKNRSVVAEMRTR